jgi:hypothetical protein
MGTIFTHKTKIIPSALPDVQKHPLQNLILLF